MELDRNCRKNDLARASPSRPQCLTRQTLDEINRVLQTVQRGAPLDLPDTAHQSRKSPAHGVYVSPTQPTIVYVTICCQDRAPWLATDKHHNLLVDIWKDNSRWVVGRYVLMPDHLHLFASPQPTAVPFDAWAKYVKSQFTKRNKVGTYVWQTDHWDTRIRTLQHYEEKTQYMLNNPVRAGIVGDSRDWRYQGVVHELRWE